MRAWIHSSLFGFPFPETILPSASSVSSVDADAKPGLRRVGMRKVSPPGMRALACPKAFDRPRRSMTRLASATSAFSAGGAPLPERFTSRSAARTTLRRPGPRRARLPGARTPAHPGRARARPGCAGVRAPGRRARRGPGRRSVVRAAERDVKRSGKGAPPALKADVALANLVIERLGLSNAFGHASARIPGGDTFLMPTRRSPGFASASTLLTLDAEGRIVSGKGKPNSELWIHARIYAARPDVGAVVHAHPPACVCLTQIGQPHRVVHNQGGAFRAGVPEYERIGLIRTRELGDLLARKLGPGVAVMMRGHGITTAATDVRTATVAACLLEESARLQLDMLASAGGDASRLRDYTREEAESVGDQISPRVVERAWEYYAAVARNRPLGG